MNSVDLQMTPVVLLDAINEVLLLYTSLLYRYLDNYLDMDSQVKLGYSCVEYRLSLTFKIVPLALRFVSQ